MGSVADTKTKCVCDIYVAVMGEIAAMLLKDSHLQVGNQSVKTDLQCNTLYIKQEVHVEVRNGGMFNIKKCHTRVLLTYIRFNSSIGSRALA